MNEESLRQSVIMEQTKTIYTKSVSDYLTLCTSADSECHWAYNKLYNTPVKPPFNILSNKPIASLGQKYSGTIFFKTCAEQIRKAGFDFTREVRGDGNCFYRSIGFGYIMMMAMEKRTNDLKLLAAL
jgi:hypothetical protein